LSDQLRIVFANLPTWSPAKLANARPDFANAALGSCKRVLAALANPRPGTRTSRRGDVLPSLALRD
jgi:hypothetical protein